MAVVDQPGYRELEDMRPLVGPAGYLMNECLIEVGISRNEISVAHTTACLDTEREDRKPLPDEIAACYPRLLDDIDRANPQVILAMGALTVNTFFPGFKVGQIRGHVRRWNDRCVVATYNPAAALPNRNPELKALIIEDIRLAVSLTRN
jgi:uracil-DNA glycosylase